jgi:hypothetical protein
MPSVNAGGMLILGDLHKTPTSSQHRLAELCSQSVLPTPSAQLVSDSLDTRHHATDVESDESDDMEDGKIADRPITSTTTLTP